ncbi:MAG: hypothetical protein GXO74_14345 [Calditrichaeota bacterium]|nr:hypothetical protein [Calditrichota bacterium]
MKFWVKKLLAKYVTYIEIIGYGFVILFIAGLIILSRVKAEDEFVGLKGELAISTDLIQSDKPWYVLKIAADTGKVVAPETALLIVTDDPVFIADKKIIVKLDEQTALAEGTGNGSLVSQLQKMRGQLEDKKYPYLSQYEVRSKIEGEFILISDELPFISANSIPGGVFNFENCSLYVSQLPVDKRMKRKLKIGQTGTAAIQISPLEKINVSVELVNLTESEADLKIMELNQSKKKKLAAALTALPKDEKLSATISVLVGSKSWMQLIWR